MSEFESDVKVNVNVKLPNLVKYSRLVRYIHNCINYNYKITINVTQNDTYESLYTKFITNHKDIYDKLRQEYKSETPNKKYFDKHTGLFPCYFVKYKSQIPDQFAYLNQLDVVITELEMYSSYPYKFTLDLFPKSLIHLILGFTYSHEIDEGVLPVGLCSLTIIGNHEYKLKKNVLPKSLKKMVLGTRYCSEIDVGVLPEFLEELVLGDDYNYSLKPGMLPNGLKKLSLFEWIYPLEYDTLPTKLEILNFESMCTHDDRYSFTFKPDVLPNKLKTLNVMDLSYQYILDQTNLPKSLQELKISPRAKYIKKIRQYTDKNNINLTLT
jgi:hypothetical protein